MKNLIQSFNNINPEIDYQVLVSLLQNKAVQSGHLLKDELKNLDDLKKLIFKRIDLINFDQAKQDVLPFIKESSELEYWNKDFFKQVTEKLKLAGS